MQSEKGYKLAILIPTYNRVSYIRAQLEQLQAQMEQWEQHVQVVVSDNCSIDGSAGVLEQYCAQHTWLKVVCTPKHYHSAEENIAFALDHCDAEYIWGLGDDDFVMPHSITHVMAVVDAGRYDFFLFNNSIYYEHAGKTKISYIPMIGDVYECPIDQMMMRIGVTTIAAAISAALYRKDLLTGELLRKYTRISPYYAHVAAYLEAFKRGRCAMGGNAVATIREARTALESFGGVARQTDLRVWEPWSVGLTRLLAHLVACGYVADDFLFKAVELGHERRYYLLHYILAHYVKQLRHCISVNQASEAVSFNEIDTLEHLCRRATPELRRIILGLRHVVIGVNALFVEMSFENIPDPRLGPPAWCILEELGPRHGAAVQGVVMDWASRELDRLDQLIQKDLYLGGQVLVRERFQNFAIFQRGPDYLAVENQLTHRIPDVVLLDMVNPIEAPPAVLIAPTMEALRERIEAGQMSAPIEDYYGSWVFSLRNGALGVAMRGDEPLDLVIFARNQGELREKLLAYASSRRKEIEAGPSPKKGDTVSSGDARKFGFFSGRSRRAKELVLGAATPEGVATLRSGNRALFDAAWYRKKYKPGSAAGDDQLLTQYLSNGQQAGHSPSPWFDEHWYCNTHGGADELRRQGFASGLDHFLRIGSANGESPSLYFDARWYMANNPHVMERIGTNQSPNVLLDYIAYGAQERLKPSPYFNENWYLAKYPEVLSAVERKEFLSGFHHYLTEGRENGSDPNPEFSERAYRMFNSDVAAAVARGDFACGFEHWLVYGRVEGRIMRANDHCAGAEDVIPLSTRH